MRVSVNLLYKKCPTHVRNEKINTHNSILIVLASYFLHLV